MDRHDLPEITAKDVARAHQEDLKIQHEYGCRAITYWFDEERQTAFCLIEAPDKDAVKNMHENSHGLIPHQIIEVNNNLVESFLGRIEDNEVPDESEPFINNEPAFRVILATNLKYSNPVKYNLSAEDIKYSRHLHNETVRQMIAEYNGIEAEHNAQCFLCSFKSVSQAIRCAIEIRKSFLTQNTNPNERMSVQIGISAGNPVSESNEFFGPTIQMAKHLCYMSNNDQITVSSEVRENCRTHVLELLEQKGDVLMLKHSEESFINQLLMIMDKTCKIDGFKLEDLAQEIGVSKSQLYRKLVALTELSPNDFVKEYRLNKAMKLIEKQDRTISEIAFETGFSSPSYFSRCFKKRFGALPTFYRNGVDAT